MNSAFVSGTSSGIGLGLSALLLSEGWRIYGCSRRGSGLHGDIIEVNCDLSRLEGIHDSLDELLDEAPSLDLAVLNAGMSSGMKPMLETSLEDIKLVMDVNVWANKLILDWLHANFPQIRQIVLISSGAGVAGNAGWSSYALSKCTLNMLTRLYSHEFPNTHMSAIAPGVTMSEMLGRHLDRIDIARYPHLQHFLDARDSGTIQTPKQAARRLYNVLDLLREHPTGQYFDPGMMKNHG